MKEFEFVEVNKPDDYCLENFHKVLANGLVKKYGYETMEEVVKLIKEKNNL